jgi:Arc/MetJ-type ribon-helix-helix transcriptional regulator
MTTKIAVSLPDHLVEAARNAVRGGRAASVSAVVADALHFPTGVDEFLGEDCFDDV